MRRFLSLLALALVVALAPAMADIYTTEADFLGAIQPGYYLQNLKGLPGVQSSINGGVFSGPTSVAFGPVNGFSFTASTDLNGGLYEVPNGLSTWLSYDILTFTFTGGSPTAVGGTFFANNNAGNTINSLVQVQLNDGTTQILSTPGFRGFTTDVGIASLKVWSVDGVNQPGVDGTTYAGSGELYVGSAVPVPEPAAMLLLGMIGPLVLGLPALLKRRLG